MPKDAYLAVVQRGGMTGNIAQFLSLLSYDLKAFSNFLLTINNVFLLMFMLLLALFSLISAFPRHKWTILRIDNVESAFLSYYVLMGKKLYKFTSLLSATAIVGVGTAFFIPNLYARFGIPDFDQRWSTVPGEGNYHCVPTAFLNAMTYMHEHGVPEVPDYGHLPIDERITTLGVLFGTDPNANGGTSGTVPHAFMVSWLGNSSNPIVLSYRYGSNTSWGVDAIEQSLAAGSIVVLSYGRYERVFGSSIFFRNGGHAVTAKGYDLNPVHDYLFVRDPADDDNNNTVQGPFADFGPQMHDKTFQTLQSDEAVEHAEYDVFNGTSDKFRAIDGLSAFMPASGGWSNSSVLQDAAQDGGGRSANNGPERIFVKVPFQFTPEPGDVPLPDEYEVTPREQVVDWVFDLGNLTVYYVTKLGRVFAVDLTDDRHHRLLHVIKGAKKLMIGGQHMDVFVLGDGSVKPGDGSVRLYRLDRHNNSMSSIMLPFRASHMEYDPRTDGPAVFADSNDRMVSVDYDLGNRIDYVIENMPTGPGKAFFRINPETGDLLYGRQGGDGVQVDSRGGRSGFMTFTGVSNLKTVVPIRGNLMIVQDGTQIQTVDGNGNRASSQFDGITNVTGIFKMNRSATFGKPFLDFGPGWHNIPPDELDD